MAASRFIPSAVEFTGAVRLGSCLSQATCQTELARLCAVDYALHLRRVHPDEPMRSPLALRLMDAAVGEVAASAEQSCEGCEAPERSRQLAAAISMLVAQASARPRGQLEVLSSPVDAEVRLNGRLLGHTPFRGTLWVGAHSLVVQRSGWKAEERRLQVLEGQTTSVHLALSEQPAPAEAARQVRPPEPSEGPSRKLYPRSLWRPTAGAVSLAGAATLLGFGAGALAVSGSCAVPLIQANEVCPRLYATTPLGAGLTATGGALALGGVLLLALPAERRWRAAAR